MRRGSSPVSAKLLSRESVSESSAGAAWAVAVIAFSGRAGKGGSIGAITVSRVDDQRLVPVGRWRWPDRLVDALAAPVWDRYGTFAGQPAIRGTVTWTVAGHRIVIASRPPSQARRPIRSGQGTTRRSEAVLQRRSRPRSRGRAPAGSGPAESRPLHEPRYRRLHGCRGWRLYRPAAATTRERCRHRRRARLGAAHSPRSQVRDS